MIDEYISNWPLRQAAKKKLLLRLRSNLFTLSRSRVNWSIAQMLQCCFPQLSIQKCKKVCRLWARRPNPSARHGRRSFPAPSVCCDRTAEFCLQALLASCCVYPVPSVSIRKRYPPAHWAERKQETNGITSLLITEKAWRCIMHLTRDQYNFRTVNFNVIYLNNDWTWVVHPHQYC